jgi:hypothetical protein
MKTLILFHLSIIALSYTYYLTRILRRKLPILIVFIMLITNVNGRTKRLNKASETHYKELCSDPVTNIECN